MELLKYWSLGWQIRDRVDRVAAAGEGLEGGVTPWHGMTPHEVTTPEF